MYNIFKKEKYIKNHFILSFAMSNYLLYGGGTNLVVANHQELFNANECSYVCIAPFLIHGRKVNVLSKYWSVIVDGKEMGVLTTGELIEYISLLTINNSVLEGIHIHHWKNAVFEELCKIIKKFQAPVYMFIHDYSTICVNFTLLKNNKFCGTGVVSKERCGECNFIVESINKREFYVELWNQLGDNLTFVCPSEISSKIWKAAYPSFESQCMVIPHQQLQGKYEGNKEENIRVRIAYLGSREEYKGWNIFKELYDELAGDERYEWFYFGMDEITDNGIKKVYVDNKVDAQAMLKALRKYQIDVAVLWSLCKETYSYTYFECYAANVYVLTNPESGNIEWQVKENSNGIVLNDERCLLEFVKNGELIDLLEEYRKNKIYGPETLLPNQEIMKCKRYSKEKTDNLLTKITMNIFGRLLFGIEEIVFLIKKVRYSK